MPRKYEIGGIKVEGVKGYEDYVLIGLSGLSVGQTISVPGDEVKIEAGEVYVNGQKLWEPYINNPPLETLQVTVPEGQYFVMGDNRNFSADSRYDTVGFVKDTEIVGHTIIRISPDFKTLAKER